jgi:hypothetical protein
MSTPTQIAEEYDIILAGGAPSSSSLHHTSDRGHPIGGAAGCVVAGRLAAADPDLRILVLEAGPPTYNNPAHRQPGRFLSHLAPGSRTVRVHASRPSAALGDRSALVPCGQCLGGGGSVNCTSVSLHFSGGSGRYSTVKKENADCYGYML